MVKWERNIRVKTHCDMDIVDFPYDSQSCPIVVSSQDNSNEYLKLSSDKWNRLNQVPEKQKIVSPNDTNTIKVSHQPPTLHQHKALRLKHSPAWFFINIFYHYSPPEMSAFSTK